jgi:UDP-N-acetylmuramoyl-tripeptide--D-alanyl-D-alanine ligase
MWRTTFIGITGSLGKTTCKEILARILKEHARTYWTIGNQNGPVLLTMNILRVRPWHRYAVIEVAGAAPGVMQWSAPKVRPDVSVVLAMRRTHSTKFETLDDHAREKTYLLKAMSGRGTVALFADDERVAAMANGMTQRITRFGVSAGCDLRAENVSANWPERLTFDLHCDGETREVRTRLVGEHWLAAVLGAFAGARLLGIPIDSAIRSVAAVDPFRGRLQPVRLPNGAIVLRDDYNAAVDSVDTAFTVLRHAQARRRILVFSDLSDFGGNRKKRLRYVGAEASRIADVAIFVGESSDYGIRRAVEAGLPANSAFGFETLPEVAEFLKRELREGDLVLLKGRTTDHIARLFFAQFGTVSCWKSHCPKTMLCDECWELGISRMDLERVTVVTPEQTSQ